MKLMKALILGILCFLSSSIAGAADQIKVDTTKERYAPYLRPEHRIGIQLNPIATLYGLGQDNIIFSGGLSYFNHEKSIEIDLPFLFEKMINDPPETSHANGTVATVALRYRKYLMGKIGGFYTAAEVRYQYANVEELKYSWVYGDTIILSEGKRIGIGFGPGYRVFSDEHLYWGIGIDVGYYFLGDDFPEKFNYTSFLSPREDIYFRLNIFMTGWAF